MTLKKYREKRNFKLTREPIGKISRKQKKKFVIQKHSASHLHYDFRLELNGVLVSWAVPKGPSLDPAIKRLAVHVEDHPIEYGNFEGIIPQGQYGGGTVMIWDNGLWFAEDVNPTQAYKDGNMKFRLEGKKLQGKWKLIRMHKDDKTWLLIKVKDEFSRSAKEYEITIEQPNSVVRNESINELTENYQKIWGKEGLRKPIQRKKTVKLSLPPALKKSIFPKIISPELASLVDSPPAGKEWLHEIKMDGYRLIAFKQNDQVRLMTRNQHDWTAKFPIIKNAIQHLTDKNIILDGEVVAFDENHQSNFQLLQNSIKENTGYPLLYYVFDLLYYDKYNLANLPLIKRKNLLEEMIVSRKSNILRYSDHIVGSGKEVLEKIGEMGLEGIISKNSNSLYIQKRTNDWLKIKCSKRQEFIIAGFTRPKGSRSFFGALLLGSYNKRNELVYNGNVGTGFSESSLKEIYNLLKQIKSNHMPFKQPPPGSKNAIWVKPELIAEVEFSEWTQEGLLRHPSFKGLRTDKSTDDINQEIALPVENVLPKKSIKKNMTNSLKLTNPNKILYSQDKFTKSDIAYYYESIQQWILPYIVYRPLTLVRCPDGYEKCFYQKHVNDTTPSSLRGLIIKEENKKEKFIYIEDNAGLMALPQLGVLEIHTWGSKVDDIDYPDIITFDLDPSPDLPWAKVVMAALDIKKYLADFKLHSFVKTTGGKGLHIVIPIKPEYTWNEIKIFTKTFADFLTLQHPDKYINTMAKSKRVGKIFVDYLRNLRGTTAIAPYSTRARIHAPIATPLNWDELTKNQKDTFYNIKSLPVRLTNLKNDPWKDFFKLKQSLRLDKMY